jgi:hypothetical protein
MMANPNEKVSVPKGAQAASVSKSGGAANKVAPAAKADSVAKPSSKVTLGGKGTGNRF